MTYTTVHPKKRAFLAAFAERGNIVHACRAAKVGRQTYYDWTEHDEEFALAAKIAQAEANDRLELVAYEWATVGVPTVKEIYEGDVLVRREVSKDISPTLLIFLMKGAKPEKYRERVDLNVATPVAKVYAGFDPSEV